MMLRWIFPYTVREISFGLEGKSECRLQLGGFTGPGGEKLSRRLKSGWAVVVDPWILWVPSNSNARIDKSLKDQWKKRVQT